MATRTKRFITGGAVSATRHVYVDRGMDDRLVQCLREGRHVNLHAGRQAGKTSLMLKAGNLLQAEGHRCVHAELSPIVHGQTLEECLSDLYRILLQQCGAHTTFTEEPGATGNLSTSFERLLRELEAHAPDGKRIYLMLDELDSLMAFSPGEIASLFLAMRKVCQANDDVLAILLVSVLTPTEMIMNHPTGGTGINFLTEMALRPFQNVADVRVQLMEQGFPNEDQNLIDGLLKRVLALAGGQPYLTCVLCNELQHARNKPGRLVDLENEVLSLEPFLISGHLIGIRKQFSDLDTRFFSVSQTFRDVIEGRRPSNTQNLALLADMGILCPKNGRFEIANPIYKFHLNREWLEELEQSQHTIQDRKPAWHQPRFRRSVALLLCGGTISMIQEQGKAKFQGAEGILKSFAEKDLSGIAEVTPVPFDPKDGINITPTHWLDIARFIYNSQERFDSFVIAHGTDTLAYTASAVAFMLGAGFAKAVVFVGAQTTINVPHGDTRANLIRACYIAAHDCAIREVQILFGDKVLRAVRAVKTDDRTFDGFDSPGWPALARVTENLLINEHALSGIPTEKGKFLPYLAGEILYIFLVPGLRAEFFRTALKQLRSENQNPIDGIVISTPGVGNIPSEEPYSFRPFIQEAVATGIPVLITSQVPINPYTQGQYEMASVPAELGAIPAGNMTIAAAYTKFSWVIGCVKAENQPGPLDREAYLKEIKQRMRINYVGEQTEATNTSPTHNETKH